MITPRNVARHELVGLRARVVESSDPSLVGIEGRIVEETARTFVVLTDEDDGEKTVPKGYTNFEFELPDATVRVEGEAVRARPAERVRGV
jgi:ribonuclease P protein subunit POP4